MTKDDILRMGREAGFADCVVEIVGLYGFMKFSELVAAAEREECAKLREKIGDQDCGNHAWDATYAIRARGNT